MDASGRRSSHNEIPSRGQDSGRAKLLPKLDIKVATGLAAFHQTFHRNSI
jgi:hypothetical protein